jgi:hypothetical protein
VVLRCHDKKARAHLADAVVSYQAGALRSSIISTWIMRATYSYSVKLSRDPDPNMLVFPEL